MYPCIKRPVLSQINMALGDSHFLFILNLMIIVVKHLPIRYELHRSLEMQLCLYICHAAQKRHLKSNDVHHPWTTNACHMLLEGQKERKRSYKSLVRGR